MLDATLRRYIDPPLDRMGATIHRLGLSANQVTLIGLGCGLLAAAAIAVGAYGVGLVLIAISRLADGLDGAVARHAGITDFGGFFDIACDFLFYGAVPLGFVLADPATNAVPGAVLLAAFYFNGTTFLGYAVLAERRGLETAARGLKSLYFTGGLLEGTETILFFVAFCLFPQAFGVLALIFAAGCVITGGSRVVLAWQLFR
ncbi:MAG: CDP-alcohol phosphatidyltransferase family protein [Devosia sp.]